MWQIKIPHLHHGVVNALTLPRVFTCFTLTLICQELSHLTSLKFLPRLLLVQKHTLRILTGPPSPVKADSWLDPELLFLGLGTFQERVSPDITSYILTSGSAPSYHDLLDKGRTMES